MKNKRKFSLAIEKNCESFIEFIVNILKGGVIIFIIMVIGCGFSISYQRLFSIFSQASVLLIILTLGYFAFYADEKERKKLIDIWKIYVAVISIMSILIHTLEKNSNELEIEYYKTKLSYSMKYNLRDINETFKSYENKMQEQLSTYKMNEVDELTLCKSKNKKINKEHGHTNFYFNFAALSMVVMTLFMFLWSLTELSIFSSSICKKKKNFKKVSKNILFKKLK